MLVYFTYFSTSDASFHIQESIHLKLGHLLLTRSKSKFYSEIKDSKVKYQQTVEKKLTLWLRTARQQCRNNRRVMVTLLDVTLMAAETQNT